MCVIMQVTREYCVEANIYTILRDLTAVHSIDQVLAEVPERCIDHQWLSAQ